MHTEITFLIFIQINGSVEFSTYDKKPVNPCNDPRGEYYSAEEREGCDFTASSIVNIGLMYNDVWAYKLCNQTSGERDFDGACQETGWELWHAGALQGGCVIQLGIEVCTVPSERYDHGSVLFDDGCLYVYGGFSQRCADYCDDIWFFDIYLRVSW
ncbi:hypothetical protein EON63_00135 [archaeon]|nr:MAG: hypothetical protein EON63_00135 [archaeon]